MPRGSRAAARGQRQQYTSGCGISRQLCSERRTARTNLAQLLVASACSAHQNVVVHADLAQLLMVSAVAHTSMRPIAQLYVHRGSRAAVHISMRPIAAALFRKTYRVDLVQLLKVVRRWKRTASRAAVLGRLQGAGQGGGLGEGQR
ncbi:hypothetical protein [Paenibacillus periandrae]|uniref:hypothetical protein n=1 Tax=Paenibacillus periandrae TaxID=1761741 RepID=UPI001F08C14E|nr:hypothetical protein [Paenibacillus periandrae]